MKHIRKFNESILFDSEGKCIFKENIDSIFIDLIDIGSRSEYFIVDIIENAYYRNIFDLDNDVKIIYLYNIWITYPNKPSDAIYQSKTIESLKYENDKIIEIRNSISRIYDKLEDILEKVLIEYPKSQSSIVCQKSHSGNVTYDSGLIVTICVDTNNSSVNEKSLL